MPPRTDAKEQKSANRIHNLGRATVIAINKISGGIGKNDDSTKAITQRAGKA